MLRWRATVATIYIALLALASQGWAEPAGDTSQLAKLAWLEGNWRGPLGRDEIEERWSAPDAGSIVASVRFTRDGTTRMFELITIQARNGTLELNLQQFRADLTSIKSEPEALRLKHLDDRRAEFASNHGAGGLAGVAYELTQEGRLRIEVSLSEGPEFATELDRL